MGADCYGNKATGVPNSHAYERTAATVFCTALAESCMMAAVRGSAPSACSGGTKQTPTLQDRPGAVSDRAASSVRSMAGVQPSGPAGKGMDCVWLGLTITRGLGMACAVQHGCCHPA